MSGVYLHVPFCARRCAYCAFYSTTAGPDSRQAYLLVLQAELHARLGELPPGPLHTIYWGGGTPSQLPLEGISDVFDVVRNERGWLPEAEITLEANPDDVSQQWAEALSRLPVNRVSLGVQTFSDNLLRLIGRRHTARQAIEAVHTLYGAGIRNLSIDLMYGLPGQTLEDFDRDILTALSLPVSHLSAYALSYEPNTRLTRLLELGQLQPTDEETSRRMYERLMDRCHEKGLRHYEISNFAYPGREARHNTAYWTGLPYLGCGPGAHSYSGRRRRWNLSDLASYLDHPGEPPFDFEELTPTSRYNDYVMTALRLPQGMDLEAVGRQFGQERRQYALQAARTSLNSGHLQLTDDRRLSLTREGLFISDEIMSDLMALDE